MRTLALFITTLISINCLSQPNCNVYKFRGDDECYRACVVATENSYPQGSPESQLAFDSAILICDSFDYAYFEKAVPFLKRGDLVTWKKLIDKAVDLNPIMHLGYRGWCRYQFAHDYTGAINDIETLDSLIDYDIGFSVNGDYHLNIAKALCYKALGQKEKAIAIIEAQLSKEGYSPYAYDLLHLAILKLETEKPDEAVLLLQRSINDNPYLADNHYYMGISLRELRDSKKSKEHLQKARELYLKGYGRMDNYVYAPDKVYLEDIERALETK